MENLNIQPKIDSDTKFLNGLDKLKDEQKIIEEKINQTNGDKKEILKMKLEDVEKQIAEYKISFKHYNKTKKTNNLKKETVEDNVVDMLNFKKRKDNNKNSEIPENLLDDLDEFKKRKSM
ncbi:hypothetical protein KAJ61_01250 [Candidatus Parcubacteria bacterium]|nr:hypothetical protein [Candidatus Parcubacteria bacterium]